MSCDATIFALCEAQIIADYGGAELPEFDKIHELCNYYPIPTSPWTGTVNDIDCNHLMHGRYVYIIRNNWDLAKLYISGLRIHFAQKRSQFIVVCSFAQ